MSSTSRMVSGATTCPRRGSATTRPSPRSRASAARTAALEKPKVSTSCASDTPAPGASSSVVTARLSRSYAAAPEVASLEVVIRAGQLRRAAHRTP